MARLPSVGGDRNAWGTVLNEFLEVSHTPDGRNKSLVVAIPFSPSITPNADTSDIVDIGILTADISVENPTGTPVDGQLLTLRFIQDETGAHALTFGNAYVFETAAVAPSFPMTANARWQTSFRWNSATSKWENVQMLGGAGSLSKVCMGFLSQSGTDAPVFTPLKDTLLGTWARTGVGTYTLTKTGAFTENKTIPLDDVYVDQAGNLYKINRTSADVMTLLTYASADTTVLADAVLSNRFINIEIYN
jgi:hypothetical protein